MPRRADAPCTPPGAGADHLQQVLADAGILQWAWQPGDADRRIASDGLGFAADTLDRVLDPRDRQADRLRFKAALRARMPYANEARFLHPERGLTWLSLSGRPLLSPDGRLLGFSGVALDVGARHALEDELEDLRALLHISLEAGQMYCWEWNLADGSRRTIGPAQRISTGSSRQGDVQALVHPEDIEEDDALLRQSISNAAPYSNRFRLLRPDGKLRWLYSRGNPSVNELGTVTHLSGVVVDVTDLRETELRLEDANRRLRLAVEAARLNPWSVDLVNERHVHGPLDGAIYGEAITSHAAFLARVLEEDHAVVARLRDDAFLRSRSPIHLQYRARHADGSIRWVACWAVGVCNDAGEPIHLVGMTQDISAGKAIEQELEESREWQQLAISAGELNLWRIDLASGCATAGTATRPCTAACQAPSPTWTRWCMPRTARSSATSATWPPATGAPIRWSTGWTRRGWGSAGSATAAHAWWASAACNWSVPPTTSPSSASPTTNSAARWNWRARPPPRSRASWPPSAMSCAPRSMR